MKINGYVKCIHTVGFFDNKTCKSCHPITNKLEYTVCLKEKCPGFILKRQVPVWNDMKDIPLRSKISFILFGFDVFETPSTDEENKNTSKKNSITKKYKYLERYIQHIASKAKLVCAICVY